VEIVPGGLHARIRGLQHHGEQVGRALPGRRTAVNLAGVAKDEVHRGQVLTVPDSLRPTEAFDARVRALAANRRPLRHNARLTLYAGAAEAGARMRLLDREELAPGDEGWVQLRLDRPVAAVAGDRFVLRTPNDTVGGGVVVDVHARRHRRHHAPTLAALAALRDGAGASPEEVRALGTDEGFAELTKRALSAVGAYHREHPLRRGLPRDELRARLRVGEAIFDEAVRRWLAAGDVAEADGAIALAGTAPALTHAQQAQVDAYVAALLASPYAPPTDVKLPRELLAYLVDAGRVVPVADGVVFAAEAYREMVDRVVAHLRSERSITLAHVRDMFGTSRKYAQALLDHLDSKRITRRVGDERVLARRDSE
jgi:selenocysteine-specific elongation factor